MRTMEPNLKTNFFRSHLPSLIVRLSVHSLCVFILVLFHSFAVFCFASFFSIIVIIEKQFLSLFVCHSVCRVDCVPVMNVRAILRSHSLTNTSIRSFSQSQSLTNIFTQNAWQCLFLTKMSLSFIHILHLLKSAGCCCCHY